jgi:hypothetical protein
LVQYTRRSAADRLAAKRSKDVLAAVRYKNLTSLSWRDTIPASVIIVQHDPVRTSGHRPGPTRERVRENAAATFGPAAHKATQ